jgi:hypothetical protein
MKERLAEYRRQQNPLSEFVSKISMVKGEPGYTPVKGKDYFTADEVQSIISFVRSQLKDGYTPVKGKDYSDGYTPVKGKDYFDGKNGDTPIRGVDYWTKQDVDSILKEIKKMIPKVKDGVSPKIEDIVAEYKKQPIKYKEIADAPDLTDLPKLIEFLKRGGFRGGGGSSTTTSATWYQDEVLTRTDGTNYTLAHTPTAVVFLKLNGQDINTTQYTRTGTAIVGTDATLFPTLASDQLVATYS